MFRVSCTKEKLNVPCQLYQREVECSVSAVPKRSDELKHKVIKVNKLLKPALVELDVQFIEHDNINKYHLNKSGLHLSARGDAALAL